MKMKRIFQAVSILTFISMFEVSAYSVFREGLGPSGFDLVRSANIQQIGCDIGNITLEGDEKFSLQSPGYPELPNNGGENCTWNVDLPANKSSNVIFECDSFDVGKGQESGRCWGDAVYISSPNNDTLTLCGKRNGLRLTLGGYSESLVVQFRSKNNTNSPGFSCLLYLDFAEAGSPIESDFDLECECGISNEANSTDSEEVIINRIIGGKEVTGNEFPWQVALVKKGLYKPFCGGSLISDRHVLTAAHCTVDLGSVLDVDVLLGEHDLTSTFDHTIRMSIKRIIEHPLYSSLTITNDFAILVLEEEVRFTKYIRPVCLPVLTEEMTRNDFADEEVTLTGWGYTTLSPIPGTDARPKRLKTLQQKVLSHDECQLRWTTEAFRMGITPSMICAKAEDPESSGCLGDSGGPLTFKDESGRYTVVGVVSFGPSTCIHQVIPNVYGRVTSVLPWILSYVKRSRLCLSSKSRLVAETHY